MLNKDQKIDLVKRTIDRHQYSDTRTYAARHDHGTTFVAYCQCSFTYTDKKDHERHVAEKIVEALESIDNSVPDKHPATEAIHGAFNL